MSGIFKSNSGLDIIFTSGVKGFKKVVTCDKHIVRFTSEITCDEYLMEVAGYLFRRYNHNKFLRYLKFKNWSGMGTILYSATESNGYKTTYIPIW